MTRKSLGPYSNNKGRAKIIRKATARGELKTIQTKMGKEAETVPEGTMSVVDIG